MAALDQITIKGFKSIRELTDFKLEKPAWKIEGPSMENGCRLTVMRNKGARANYCETNRSGTVTSGVPPFQRVDHDSRRDCLVSLQGQAATIPSTRLAHSIFLLAKTSRAGVRSPVQLMRLGASRKRRLNPSF